MSATLQKVHSGFRAEGLLERHHSSRRPFVFDDKVSSQHSAATKTGATQNSCSQCLKQPARSWILHCSCRNMARDLRYLEGQGNLVSILVTL